MNDGSESYTAKDIQVLTGLEGVRKRPAMYIGDTGKTGLHHLVYEIVDNAIDESLAGYCKNIEVALHADGSVSVKDDGRGIPTEIHPQTGKSTLEVISLTLHAGAKFEKSVYKVSGGLHGVGMSVVNALSERMEIEVHRGGKKYHQSCSRGKLVSPAKEAGATTYRGTVVRFKPDPQIFSVTEYDFDYLKERFMELAFLNKTITITFTDERASPPRAESFHYEGGIVEFVQHMNKARNALHVPFYYHKQADGVDVEFAIQYTESYSELLYSFVNNIRTVEGGTHVSGFRAALTRTMNEYLHSSKQIKEEETKVTGDDAAEGITAVISVKIPEPQFEGQTKTKLGNGEVKGIVDSITYEALLTYLDENPDSAKPISLKVLNSLEAREAAQKAKDLIRRKNIFETSVLPGKLADCESEDAAKSELYIVEGDSAGGCFSGDTKIALADGRELTFKQLVEEHAKGKRNFCYTMKGDGSIGIEEIRHSRVTRRNAEVVRVTFDNGEQAICTPDHQFMLRDGSYAPVKGITKSVSLMTIRNWNHKIRKIEYLNEPEDVYDIEVPNTHNFALACGVFVHNSMKQARDRQYQAVLPLRGKILNVEKAPINKMLMSEEIKAIILSLGAGFGEDFNLDKMRYHKIVIATDADVDGSHIQTLLLTLFYRYFKAVIDKGYIYIATPPLYKVWRAKDVRYAYSDMEKDKLAHDMGSGASIQRYKGLGEMNPEQLWDTTINPENRTLKKVTIEDAMRADELFDVLMGEKVEPRRKFIEDYAREVKNLDI